MAKITDDMKAFLKGRQAFIATATPDGIPNVGPKGSIHVLDEEHLAYYELTGKEHYQNLLKNPRISVAVADAEKVQGFRFQGLAELVTQGPLYERAAQWAQKNGFNPPKAVVRIKVENIYNLGMADPGKKIA